MIMPCRKQCNSAYFGGTAVGRWPGKYVIGLTGNIAMGKSLVRRMLDYLGAYTIDADGLAHQAMAPGAPAYAPTIRLFGQWILDAEKRIDRAKLGAVVFSHPEALARLEALTHPIIGHAIDTLIQRARHDIVVVEAIKLLEGSLAGAYDAIWVVDADEDAQVQRLEKRGLSYSDAIKRIRVQNPQADKLAKADVVINNSGTPENTWEQVRRAWSRIPVLQAQPAAEQQAAVSEQPAAAGAITIVRGKPSNAARIAAILQEHMSKTVDQYDILMKSYMMAMMDGEAVGLVGFVVENLVTRCDEFIITHRPAAPAIGAALIESIERASRDLQSEVGYIFLPEHEPDEHVSALLSAGYEKKALEDIRIPAWREAARESRPEGYQIFSKKLRAERVLKPL